MSAEEWLAVAAWMRTASVVFWVVWSAFALYLALCWWALFAVVGGALGAVGEAMAKREDRR